MTEDQLSMIKEIQASRFKYISTNHYDITSVELKGMGLVYFEVNSHERVVYLTNTGRLIAEGRF